MDYFFNIYHRTEIERYKAERIYVLNFYNKILKYCKIIGLFTLFLNLEHYPTYHAIRYSTYHSSIVNTELRALW